MRQGDKRAATISHRETGKIPTRGWQRSFSEIPVDDAQLRFPFEENALACQGSLQHRRGIIGKVRFDNKRVQMPGSFLRSQTATRNCVLQRSVDR